MGTSREVREVFITAAMVDGATEGVVSPPMAADLAAISPGKPLAGDGIKVVFTDMAAATVMAMATPVLELASAFPMPLDGLVIMGIPTPIMAMVRLTTRQLIIRPWPVESSWVGGIGMAPGLSVAAIGTGSLGDKLGKFS